LLPSVNAGVARKVTAQTVFAEAAITILVAIGWTLLDNAAVGDFGGFFDFGFGQTLPSRANLTRWTVVVTLALAGGAGHRQEEDGTDQKAQSGDGFPRSIHHITPHLTKSATLLCTKATFQLPLLVQERTEMLEGK
jgi:hypothetical protein